MGNWSLYSFKITQELLKLGNHHVESANISSVQKKWHVLLFKAYPPFLPLDIWFGSRWWRAVIFCNVRAIVKQVLLLHVSQKQKHAHQDHIIIITILYLRWKQNITTFQKTSEDEVCGTLFMLVIVKMSIWSGGTLKIYCVGLLYFIYS